MSRRLASALLLIVASLVWGGTAQAQTTIRGVVTDAKTGRPLPQANVRVADTYQGTITNQQGRYALRIDSLPATVVVRYIGYDTVRRRLTASSDARQDVALAPATMAMDEVVVTGSRNPGREIMRRVIEQKQTWWDSLRTYQVDAYSRYTLSDDTSVVAINEVQTRTFWDRTRGTREVVRARRGAGLLDSTSIPAAETVLNLYRDNVEVLGSELMGVTHPDALDRYTFTLDTTRVLDEQRVYDIRVEPKSRLASAFRGRVSVLDSAYALIEARLKPARSLRLPRLVKGRSVAYEQQFSNFGGPYWLPVDFRAEVSFRLEASALLTFPRMYLRHVARLSDYEVNVPLPDSLYAPDADSSLVAGGAIEGTLPTTGPVPPDSQARAGAYVPLTAQERRVYATPDSARLRFTEAFQPGGLLGGLLDLREDDGTLSVGGDDADEGPEATGRDSARTAAGALSSVDVSMPRPTLWYNRVEGVHLGAKTSVDIGDALTLRGRGGHSFAVDGPARWSYGGAAEMDLPTALLDQATISYRYGIDPRYDADARLFPPLTRGVNSLWTLFGEPDYYDYFGAERWRLGVSAAIPGTDVTARLQARTERHFSVTGVTDYNLLGRNTVFGRRTRQPPNPPINDGRLRSLALRLQWGDDPLLFGVMPADRVVASIEHSSDALGSDFGFTYGEIAIDTGVETFFRRRLMPNRLELRLTAGGALGTLPLQRFGVVEASPLPYTPFGSLRTLDDRPYQAPAHAALFWEHNFRTVPFELLGLYGLADRHIGLILHGGHARTWIDDDRQRALRRRGVFLRTSEGGHHELGLSVNGLLRDLVRVDLTARLDRRAFSVGVSLLRFI